MSQVTKPTANSPETQQLIDLCFAVADGQADQFPELEHAVGARQSALNAASDQFFAGIESQDNIFQNKFKAEIELLTKYFESYDQALEQILRFKGEPKAELLHEAAHVLAFVSHGLPSAMAAYEQKFLGEGQHRFPIVNLFTNLGKMLRDGKAELAGWQATCDQYREFYKTALKEVEEAKDQTLAGHEQRRKALQDLVTCLDEMHRFTAQTSAAKFDTAMQELADGHRDLEGAVSSFNESLLQGDSPSAAINFILRIADGVLAEEIEPKVLRDLCTTQLEKVQKSIGELQMVVRAQSDSAVLQEESPRMLESLELMEEALTGLIAFCDGNGTVEEAEAALADIKESTQIVDGSTKRMEAHNESYGKVLCPGCQTPNPPTNKTCSQCNRVLPQMAGSEVYSSWASTSSFQVLEGESPEDTSRDTVITDVMQALFQACEKFEQGKLPLEELLAHLDRSQHNINEAYAVVSKLQPPPIPDEATEEERAKAQEFIDLCADSLELLNQGVEECDYGIQQIREGAHEDSHEKLQEGQKFYFQGCQKLWQVKRVDDTLQKYLHADDEATPASTTETYDSTSV